MDAIAPLKTKVLSGRKKSPWRNATAVRSQRTKCRQAERRWRKTKLQVHYDIYKDNLRIYNKELKGARQSFFSEVINKNNNSRTLFAVVDRLTNPSSSVPPELLSSKSCNDFADFFTDKILKIRQTMSSSTSGNMALSPMPPDSLMNLHFKLLDCASLTETIQQLKSTTCCLAVYPQASLKIFLTVLHQKY